MVVPQDLSTYGQNVKDAGLSRVHRNSYRTVTVTVTVYRVFGIFLVSHS